MHGDLGEGASRRQVLRQGAKFLGASGALSFLDAGGQASASPCVPRGEQPGTSPVHALPKPVRENLDHAMRRAIKVARAAGKAFGAVLVDVHHGRIVAAAANAIVPGGDPSAHAEVEVLRKGALRGVVLKNTVLVTTAESCPMCATCAIWAGVAGVAYGTSLEFLIKSGRGSIRLSQPEVVAAAPPELRMPIVGDVLHRETDPLFVKK